VDAARSDKDLYSLRYGAFVVPLTKAVQELSARNDELKKENEVLEKQSELILQRLAKLKQKMN
jgi:chaperonin cofactor prefoldin